MGRFVSPGSLRFGKLIDWKPISENIEGFWKSKVFLDYLKGVLNKYLLLEEGIVFGNIKFTYQKQEVLVKISIYDRPLELVLRDSLRNGESVDKIIEQSLLKKLTLLKCLISREGEKYFGVPVKVTFIGLSLRGLSAEMLSKYISLSLEQGYSLQEILRMITRELGNQGQKKKTVPVLNHRYLANYSEDSKEFSPYMIGDQKLLGFRIDCKGRFTRKQRASKKSIREGIVSLGNYKGYLDYGYSTSILDYGACGVKVWLYFENKSLEDQEVVYIFKY